MGVVHAAAAAAGPAVGGLLMELVSGNQAVLLCAAGILAVTVLSTVSPTLRNFPRYSADDESLMTMQAPEQRSES